MSTDLAQAVQAILSAGKATSSASDRLDAIDIKRDGQTITLPVSINQLGAIEVLEDVLEAAEREQERTAPTRRGSYRFEDLSSLISWVQRYRTDDTAAFITAPCGQQPGEIAVVIDELPKEIGGTNRKLRASVTLQLHDRLGEWLQLSGSWCTPEAFHTFISERADDLGTADVLTMVTNVEVSSSQTFRRTVDEAGRVRVQAEDASGPAMRVPTRFTFATPVFDFDDPDNVNSFTARLAMKIEKGKPLFRYEIIDLKARLREALQVMRQELLTTVPNVYAGRSA